MRELHVLLRGNVLKILRDHRAVKPLEAVPLAAGKYRGGNLLKLRRREDEHQMLRRLLKDLEQGVESRSREHVHLVDDVHALFHGGRREHGLVPQRADIVNAVIGCRVQLHHVEYRPVRDAAAGGADAAGAAVHRMLAVHRAGEDARTGGLARAARADKDVSVGEPTGHHLVFQRLGYVLLSDDLIKDLRPPFAVQRLIHSLLTSYYIMIDNTDGS